MDYNIENKGFVCFVYNLQRRRAFWAALLTVLAIKFILCELFLGGAVADALVVKLRFATLFATFGVCVAMCAPKVFGVKLAGFFLIFLGVIFGLDYSMSDFSGVSEIGFPFALPLNEICPSFFAPDFSATNEAGFTKIYAWANFAFFAVFGAFCLVMILSWFVYNARSSEINQI
ncbi:hypothetical protein [uncultured Campylobacter sp.]|uniref:hypothetical protein n=1 Tax=uncultured Campylobacter sp. TaxID=218934 RepID=UPI0026214B62|nr:hypothetical protein [uncultured Campylobacter sp.]